jgi:hypothetical protein
MVSFGAYNMAGGQYKKIFGREVGPFCDSIYEDHVKKEVQRFYESTNISVKIGDCPVPAQYIDVHDFRMGGLGDYLPPYVPGEKNKKVSNNFMNIINLFKRQRALDGRSEHYKKWQGNRRRSTLCDHQRQSKAFRQHIRLKNKIKSTKKISQKLHNKK